MSTLNPEHKHILPFDDDEMLSLLEIARICLEKSSMQTQLCDELDMNPEDIEILQEKLEDYLNS